MVSVGNLREHAGNDYIISSEIREEVRRNTGGKPEGRRSQVLQEHQSTVLSADLPTFT